MPRYIPTPATPRINLTPLIDVVFLLIIFFMLVCQFIARDNLQLVVPDDCSAARPPVEEDNPLTLAIYPAADSSGELVYHLHGGPADIPPRQWTLTAPPPTAELAAAIAARTNGQNPPATLRADAAIAYQFIAPALQAFAQAQITEVRIAGREAKIPTNTANN